MMDASSFKDKSVIPDYADFLRGLSAQYNCDAYIGGIIGCKGDAYTGEGALNVEDALSFHTWQINEFAKAKVDFIFEAIMPAIDEIIGISMLVGRQNMPYIVSFMIRGNGKIIDGHSIHDAITIVDSSTEVKPLCYMTNCVHPDILRNALSEKYNDTDTVRARFGGIQANAVCAEPDELDSLLEMKTSPADELANSFLSLNEVLPIKICGGCCGTDDRHIREIAKRLSAYHAS